jgi:beta-glucosidase-like glycosyl hydrolase
VAQNQFINVGIDQGAAKKSDLSNHQHAITNGAAAAGDLTVSWDSAKFTTVTLMRGALTQILRQLGGQLPP